MLIFVLVGATCTNSGLGKTDQTSGDTADEPTGSASDCPWVGTWTLEGINCSTFPYDDWYDDHDGATLVIAQDATSGCAVEATITGATCERTEDWLFGPPVGTSVAVTLDGISNCSPAACTFAPSDTACSKGDLTKAEETLTIDESNGSMQAVGLITDTAAGCPLDVVTTWSKQ